MERAIKDLLAEIEYAKKWSTEFDDANTANDWAAYIAMYTGDACKMPIEGPGEPFEHARFRRNMLKVASLAMHAVSATDRGGPKLRHYDQGGP